MNFHIPALTILMIITYCNYVFCKDEVFITNGIKGYYRVYIPENLPPNAPLIFVLHGRGESNKRYYRIGFNPIADTAGFALCFPQGDNREWNGLFRSDMRDDLAFLTELARHLQKEYNLNPDNTFIVGFSNGAYMANSLLFRASDVFRAEATVAGLVMEQTLSNYRPSRPIPVFHMHGTSDGSIHGIAEHRVPSADSLVNYWSHFNDTATSDSLQLTSNTTAYYHRNGKNNTEVWYYKINDGGHVWPGSGERGDVAGFNACSEIWKFFRKYLENQTYEK